jgi:hypothetical protein
MPTFYFVGRVERREVKTRFRIEEPDAIEATMEITMRLSDWIDLRDQLASEYPSWRLTACINSLVAQAHKEFYPTESNEGEK